VSEQPISPEVPADATSHTAAYNSSAAVNLDERDFELASRGLLSTIDEPIPGGFGDTWNVTRPNFIGRHDACPPTVHPSLWRQSQLNSIHGLFEVADGVWQARGYDISNITFIAGTDGWVIIDPLTTVATATACLSLANRTLGERPVTGVIYTHSHADHYGGVAGVTTAEQVAAGNCTVVAPAGFMREVVAENVIAGPAMTRRALYQFGPLLPPGPRGQMDCGLGKAMPLGASSLIAPTVDITLTGQELTVDGVRIVFQNTPGTEAPAEMNFFFPDHGWLCLAENCTQNMHNLVPIRGAQVRDSLDWSKYIGEAIELFGNDASLCFASHHWPRWGAAEVGVYLRRQRDLYRWIHDQTMRRANLGFTAPEIANMLVPPSDFADHGDTRGYYGHLGHNVRAVYQRYLSWYDGNPARLDPHPPVEAARRYVECMGGAAAALAHAQAAFDAGDYRWAAELGNHLVFADPTSSEARALQAKSLEQLGYQSESATFRNAYLQGAQELRSGHLAITAGRRRATFEAMPTDLMLDAVAVRLKSEEVEDRGCLVNLTIADGANASEDWLIGIDHCALHAVAGRHDPAAGLTITIPRTLWVALVIDEITWADLAEHAGVVIDGDPTQGALIFEHLDHTGGGFAIIEP
jgi:alkyl sulfatase BDS1-like metallo-beta-lactamase superfamily hydrolase